MTKLKGIMLNICSTCHMHCKHCSNIHTLHDRKLMDIAIAEKCINEMDALGLETITLVGGEPFEEFEHLRIICEAAYNKGKKIGIITNGFWAYDITDGEEKLSMLPGVSNIVLSSDLYHLEFVSESTVRNAVNICKKKNIPISIHAVCANKEDAKKVKEIYKDLGRYILINTGAPMPIGAAKDLDIERFKLRDRIDRFSKFCSIGNIYVDINGNVYGCCNASLAVDDFLFYGNLLEKSPKEVFGMVGKDATFQYLQKNGPRGIQNVLAENENRVLFFDKEYTCECDACVDISKSMKYKDL